LPLVTNYGKCC